MASIGIDARKYFDFGIGTYIQNLILGLSAISTIHSYAVYVSHDDAPEIFLPDGWKKIGVRYGKYSIGEIVAFGRQVRRQGVDLFHSPHYTLPIGLKRRSVVTIHDLTHLRFPQYFNPIQRSYAHIAIRHAVRHAGAIITDSEFTKQDILRLFRIHKDNVHVVHLGVREDFKPVRDQEMLQAFRNRYRLQKPYILYVGSTKPHKNIPTLLHAFKNVSSRYNDLYLVFAGESFFENKKLMAESNSLRVSDRIIDLGRLTTDDLRCAYSSAEMLVLPSEYEGFGLPAVEAMACETPVIVSNGGSLPEIAGQAALVFALGQPNLLFECIDNLMSNTLLRKDLIAKGKKNLLRFSWRVAAQKTLKIYESLL